MGVESGVILTDHFTLIRIIIRGPNTCHYKSNGSVHRELEYRSGMATPIIN